MKKLLLIGHARHGKDTTAEMLWECFGYTFESSSEAAAKIFLFDKLKEKYNYKNFFECFEDRVNHRAEWFDLICEFNKEDKARLAKEIMKGNDIYVGMRSNDECDECIKQNVFDLIIGVFDPRKPLENQSSFNIDMWSMADVIISNAGTIEDLRNKILKLQSLLV